MIYTNRLNLNKTKTKQNKQIEEREGNTTNNEE